MSNTNMVFDSGGFKNALEGILDVTRNALSGFKTLRTSYNPVLNELERLGEAEKTMQLHIPGHNYTGPGTHVVSNVLNGIRPVDWLDSISQKHDLDYSRATTKTDIFDADASMINEIDRRAQFGIFSPEEAAAKLALKLKNLLGIDYGISKRPLNETEYSMLMDLSRMNLSG